jgi:hypothetical protein
MARATVTEIIRMFSVLKEHLGEGINDFDSGFAQEIINDGPVRGRECMRFLKNRAFFDLRDKRPHFFIVTSDGRAPSEISGYVKQQGSTVGNFANSVINHPSVSITNGVAYLMGVFFGDEFTDEERTNKNIDRKAGYRGWMAPPVETAHLSRLKISDEMLKKMGLWRLIIMNDPVLDSQGIPSRLALTRSGDGQWLGARCGRPDFGWKKNDGFAYLVPQISL